MNLRRPVLISLSILVLGGLAVIPIACQRQPAATTAVPSSVAASSTSATSSATSAPSRPPDVIVYLIDTLRPDRLGAYGSTRGLSPRIDRLAEESWVFERAVANSSWTRPSTVSLLTGLRPESHGVTRLERALAPQAQTLAEFLRDRGYHTVGFSTNHNASASSGLDQGFVDFQFKPAHDKTLLLAPQIEAAIRRTPSADTPLFLYVHVLDPHAPYNAERKFRERFAPQARTAAGAMEFILDLEKDKTGKRRLPYLPDLEQLYDAEVAGADAGFARVLRALRKAGRYDNAVIVLTSDHGEEFNEHGSLQHAENLHHETVDIPLVVKLPGARSKGRSPVLAEQIDLLPTVLAAAGVPLPEGLQGRDLLAGGQPGEAPGKVAVAHLMRQNHAVSVTTPDFRMILNLKKRDDIQVFDRRADYLERRSIAAQRPELVRELTELLRRERAADLKARIEPLRIEPDAEAMKAFKALGYIGN